MNRQSSCIEKSFNGLAWSYASRASKVFKNQVDNAFETLEQAIVKG